MKKLNRLWIGKPGEQSWKWKRMKRQLTFGIPKSVHSLQRKEGAPVILMVVFGEG